MGDMTARGRRVVAVFAAALVVLVTFAAQPARSAPTVYTFSLTYQGTCEGFTAGEIRVDGGTVELWGASGGELQKVGSSVREPDDSFTISVPEAGFTMNGTLTDAAVSGTGTFKYLGSNCPFTFSGTRVGAPGPTTTTMAGATDVQRSEGFSTPEEEFDPSKSGPLSIGELKNVLRRAGRDADEVDEYLLTLERRSFDDPSRANLIGLSVAQLAVVTDDDGRPLFPTLNTLYTRDPDCPCPSVMGRLAQGLKEDPETATFNRLVRVAVSVDL